MINIFFQELIGNYIFMEEYFMRETVMKVSCAMFDVIRVFPSNAWTHSSLFWFDHSTACNTLCLVGVSELKSLRGQGVSEFRLVMRAIFRICGNESQPGLQIVEKLTTPLRYQ